MYTPIKHWRVVTIECVHLAGHLIVYPESRLIAFYHMHTDSIVCMYACMYVCINMYGCIMRECMVVIDHILLGSEQNYF